MLNRLKDVFASLHARECKYLVIGGIASVLHGVPRATFDLDILIEATPENAARLLEALRNAKFATAEMITAPELLQQDITIFNDRVRIDVPTRTPGLEFGDAGSRRDEMSFDGQVFPVLCRQDLIASKLAAARPVDLEDAKALENSSRFGKPNL